MYRIDRYITVTDAKNRLLDLVRKLGGQQEVFAITRDGAPTAVLMSIEQYDGLIETIDILSDRNSTRPLRRSLKQAAEGRWVSHEAVFGRERR